MILNPAARARILSGGQHTIRIRSLHRAYPSLHPFGVVYWVPEQLNIKVVTGACPLIDGCSLELCSATPSVAPSGICNRIKLNSIAWLFRDGSIRKYTLHYIPCQSPWFLLWGDLSLQERSVNNDVDCVVPRYPAWTGHNHTDMTAHDCPFLEPFFEPRPFGIYIQYESIFILEHWALQSNPVFIETNCNILFQWCRHCFSEALSA